jgi:hypothetical protein
MYRTLLLPFLLVVANSCQLHAQDVKQKGKNTILLSLTSYTPYYSLQYDRLFKKTNQFRKSGSIGIAYFENTAALPIGIHFFKGKEPHHLLLNLLVVPYIENINKLFAAGNQSDKKLYITPGVGYRYQKNSGGLFCSMSMGPVLNLDPPSVNIFRASAKISAGGNISFGISL